MTGVDRPLLHADCTLCADVRDCRSTARGVVACGRSVGDWGLDLCWLCGEAGLMTSGAEYPPPAPAQWRRRASLEEQARAKETRPIGDGSFYAREELFTEPGELDEFLEYVHEARRAGTA